MLKMQSKFDPPTDIIDTEKKRKKFLLRYNSLYSQMKIYVEKSGYSEDVIINEIMLGYALVDYFEDIERIKRFHNIQHINSIKVTAYTIYWLLQRKPIQIISNSKDLLYVNEHFALAFVLNFLSTKNKGHIALRQNTGLVAFKESLFYFFKFRQFNAQDIELMIIAFFAGQIYQESNADLSCGLPSSDYEDEPWD